MTWLLAILLAFVIVTVLLSPLALFGGWILRPLEEAAKARRAPIRFALSDVLCLFLNIQLPLGALAWLLADGSSSVHFGVVLAAAFWGTFIWASSVAKLSRAGVSNGKQRLIFLGAVVPIVFYGLPFFIALAWMAIGDVILGIFGGAIYRPVYAWLFFPWLATGLTLIACGVFTHRMVPQTAMPLAKDDTTPSQTAS